MISYDVYICNNSVHTLLSTDSIQQKRLPVNATRISRIPVVEFQFEHRKLYGKSARSVKSIVSKVFRKFLSLFDKNMESKHNLTKEGLEFYNTENILYGGYWQKEMYGWLDKHDTTEDLLFDVLCL